MNVGTQRETTRSFEITETSKIPVLSLVLGYGPMLLVLAGGLLAWIGPVPWRHAAGTLTGLWAACLLAFLAGVRRGLSFRTEGGPRVLQLVTMFVLFCLAFGALVALPIVPGASHGLLLGGFGLLLVADPLAAERGEAPAFFARLRPPQIGVAALGLVALLIAR